MSSIKLTYLYCDGGDECPRRDGQQEPFKVDPVPDEDATLQRAQAKLSGWQQKGRKDYCPVCAESLQVTDRSKANGDV